jgi:hypothetical protein
MARVPAELARLGAHSARQLAGFVGFVGILEDSRHVGARDAIGSFMRRLILTALAMLGLLAPATLAEQVTSPPPGEQAWRFFRFSGGALAWNLDAGRWHDNNDRAEGQSLLFYSPPMDVDGNKIVWVHESWRIRCAANTYQVLRGEEINANLATVFDLRESEPSPISKTSPESILKLVYCDNVTIEGAGDATGLLGVMEAMSGVDPLAPRQ